MKRIILLSILSFCLLSVQAQDYWKTYRDTDGLANRASTSIAVYNKVVYAATPSGLSVLENGVFTNYDTSNSSLPSQNIKLIKNYRDTVWFATDSGLTEFVNGQMKHYSDTNGLLNNVIQDLEVDSKGNLWIASFDGLTKKEGDVFNSETGRKIFNIAINKGDSIYANVNFEGIANIASPVLVELFDGNSWTTLRDPNLISFINKATFVNLNDSIVGVLSADGRVFQVDSVFNLSVSQLPDNFLNITNLSDMAMDARGSIWYSFAPAVSTVYVEGGLFRFNGTDYEFLSTGLPSNVIYDIEVEGNVVYLATENGISFTVDSLESIKNEIVLETNSIKFSVNSDGTLFRSVNDFRSRNNLGLNFPKGTNKSTIYSAGIALGEPSDLNSRKLAVQEYDQGDFSPGTINSNGNLVSPTMINISKFEIDFHLENYSDANYIMSKSIKDWPGNGRADFAEGSDQAPFVDANNNGCYDPENGDYPYIIGDKAVYLVINDAVTTNAGQEAPNLNVEVQMLVYVFDQPDIDYLDKTAFVRYAIVNRSNIDYADFRTGFFYDFDIGGGTDDYFGSDPGSDLFFAYNADNSDESSGQGSGYNSFIPATGVKVLSESLDGFMGYVNLGTGRTSYPFTPGHYFNAFDYLWNNGTPVTMFGDGYNPSLSNTTNHIYNGDITNSNEWSALNPGPGLAPIDDGEIRGLGMVSPFELKRGERKIIDIAIGIGFDSSNVNYLDNVSLMINNLNSAANFQRGLISILPDPTYATCITGLFEDKIEGVKKLEISLYPNPTSGELNVLSQQAILEIQIVNVQGQIIARYVEIGTSTVQKINLPNSIPNGIYMVQVLTETGQLFTEKLMIQK